MTIDSPSFLALCLAGVIVCRVGATPTVRDVGLLGVNILALTVAITSRNGAIVLAVLLASVYVLGEIVARANQARAAAITATAVIGLWGLLFLLKDPGLAPSLNPFAGFPVAILGISYMTFRCISYLVEVGVLAPQGVIRFVNYVVFFPTLVAGPIDRWRNFHATMVRPLAEEAVLPSLHRIANGFIKKFVLADNLSEIGVPAVSHMNGSGVVAPELLWLAAASQLFLIYLDFSGYCDIVIGVARLMGIRVIENFDRPFRSRNIQEFWERWHISLTSLLRDYIFSPVTKVILTRVRPGMQWPLVVSSYFFVMILIALWHGTATGFLVFGIVHGAALVAYQGWRRYGPRIRDRSSRHTARNWLAAAVTYLFVSISLAFWLSENNSWPAYFRGMLGIAQ